MPKTRAAANLKEISWSGLVRSAWEGYMRNKSILVPLAIPAVFSLILAFFQMEELAVSIGATGALIALLLVVIALIPLSVYASAAAISIVRDSRKGKARLADAWKTANRKFWSLLGASLLVGLIFMAIYLAGIASPLVMMVVSASIRNLLLMAVSLVWMIIGLAALIITSILLSFAGYAVVISDTKAVEGVKTSWNFVKRNFWSAVILFIIIFLVSMPLFLLGLVTGFANIYYPEYQIPLILLQTLFSWLISPFFIMLSGYFYMLRKK